jgi:hypothetical protein
MPRKITYKKRGRKTVGGLSWPFGNKPQQNNTDPNKKKGFLSSLFGFNNSKNQSDTNVLANTNNTATVNNTANTNNTATTGGKRKTKKNKTKKSKK